MQRRSTVKLGAVMFAALVAVSACSSGDRGGADAGAAPATGASTASATAAKFGTLDSPCGKGDAKGSTDQGVTDTSITIGYGDDRGFAQLPGLNKEIGDAVKGMMKWCNDQGGINGRTIEGNYYDAALTQVNTVMQKACKSDFMLVGEGFAGDEGAEQTRVACNLPAVPAFGVGPDVTNGPMLFHSMSNPVDYQAADIFYQLAEQFPDIKDGFAFMGTNLPAGAASVAKARPAVEAAGYKVLDCGVTLNYAGEPNYVPFAQKFKDCGAKVIYLSTTPGPQIYDLLTAMNQVDAHPKYIMQANGYTEGFAKWNKEGLADQVYVRNPLQPTENADKVPAVQQYIDVVDSVKGDTSELGMQGASSFLLWATAAKDCGSDLTRQCMVNKLSKVHKWTGGGLSAPSDPGANLPPTCSMVLKMDKTTWKQSFPTAQGEFDCDDKYQVKVPEALWGTTLNADRIATKFLTPDVIKPQS